jgi:hypothetical protein
MNRFPEYLSLNCFGNFFAGLRFVTMAISSKLSRYTEDLKAYIDAKQAGQPTLSDTEERSLKNTWMQLKLLQDGITIKTGQLASDFVRFDHLDKYNQNHHDAISEVDAETLPSIYDFYLIFAIMCHLNDKAVDPDKLCMPRRSRLLAIEVELKNPGTTEAPIGYAGENKASWKHEVKENWKLYKCGRPGKDTDGCYSVELESAYVILSTNHIKKTNNGIKHLGRDNTQKVIREKFNISFPTQIIKDFVAACPGCSASDKRKARIRGAATTKGAGRNRGPKNQPKVKSERLATKRPRDEFESTLGSPNSTNMDTEYRPTKKPCKDTNINRSAHTNDSHNKYQFQVPSFEPHQLYFVNSLFGMNDFPPDSKPILASHAQDEKLSDINMAMAQQLINSNYNSYPSEAAYNHTRSIEVNDSAQQPTFHATPRQEAFMDFMASCPRNTNYNKMDLNKVPLWVEYYRHTEYEQELFATVKERFTRYPIDDRSSCIGYKSCYPASISHLDFGPIQPQQMDTQPIQHAPYVSNGGSFNYTPNNSNFNRSSSVNSPAPSNVALFDLSVNYINFTNPAPGLTLPKPIDNFAMIDPQLYEQAFEQGFGTMDIDDVSMSESTSHNKPQPENSDTCNFKSQESHSNHEIDYPTSVDNDSIQWAFELDAALQERLQSGTVPFEDGLWFQDGFNTNESQSEIPDSSVNEIMEMGRN